ncbi:MAG: MBL fold metallo-hydrolase [Candidatus Glassbacteria bacterium]|nr:MBL fold metallo-hydrolase [Candidatus Glassbacteria bacterium]
MLNRIIFSLFTVLVLCGVARLEAAGFDKDTIGTGAEKLLITFIGHGTLMFEYGGLVVHADPTLRESDYADLPKADLILITHEHGDHLDPEAVAKLRKPETEIVANGSSAGRLEGAVVMKNGESATVMGLKIEAVPAYNIISKRDNGQPYHPKGNGNGYVVTFGDTRVYIAGDTEYVPEMNELGDIDIAFLPLNLPYTMTVEMAAEAARAVSPKVFYPYHYGSSEVGKLQSLLEGAEGIELRIREMQ